MHVSVCLRFDVRSLLHSPVESWKSSIFNTTGESVWRRRGRAGALMIICDRRLCVLDHSAECREV